MTFFTHLHKHVDDFFSHKLFSDSQKNFDFFSKNFDDFLVIHTKISISKVYKQLRNLLFRAF